MNKFIVTIDLGNTNHLCCLFDQQDKMLSKFSLEDWPNNLTQNNCLIIYSSVRKINPNFPIAAVDAKSFLKNHNYFEMPVHYSQSLGTDRLVVAYGVFDQKPLSPTVIIDSGTFTTIDIITEQGFMGGYILPGLNLLQANYLSGQSLFEVESFTDHILPFPKNSSEAITKGAAVSFLAPITELLQRLSWVNIVITGGNGELIASYLQKHPLCQDASIQNSSDLIHKSLLKIARKVSL